MNRLQFYFKAQTAHGLHSPSIYALYCKLLNPFLNGQLTYEQLVEELKKRYTKGKIIEMSSEFDPAKMTLNDVILIQQPYKNETFWNSLKSHTSVIQTVDLYDVGLVFFKPICPKQNFYLRKM
ncbi:MAG: hypothetical protein RLZZ96_1223 [Bacteroidota bacterium]|jgi:hypothetical protein